VQGLDYIGREINAYTGKGSYKEETNYSSHDSNYCNHARYSFLTLFDSACIQKLEI